MRSYRPKAQPRGLETEADEVRCDSLSSDDKQLKVSLSRSRGQRSLPKGVVLQIMVRETYEINRLPQKIINSATIGSMELDASLFCITPFCLSLYSFKAHGEMAQWSCSSTVRRLKEHYLLRIVFTG